MEAEIFKTRHNIMNISSIESFMNIKGSVKNNCKDVYFLRIVGINKEILREIEHMDRVLTEKMQAGNGFYDRVNALPKLAALEDIEYYSKSYENWKKSGKQGITIKAIEDNKTIRDILGNACYKVLNLFYQEKSELNNSIEKNFVVKMLYWLDHTVSEALHVWLPDTCRKMVFSEISKKQEYLFCYLLTLLGFDVLLLQTGKDIDRELEAMGLSVKHMVKNPIQLSIPEYTPLKSINNHSEKNYDKRVFDKKTSTETVHTIVNTRVPERDRRTKEMLSAKVRKEENQKIKTNTSPIVHISDPRRQKENQRIGANVNRTTIERQELKYEELALLASSVVQILIHDKFGNPIGGGSGIMIGEKGYILTNNHVACRGNFYSVRIEEDEQIYETDEMIKYNSVLDLAVIRIHRTLKPIPIYRGAKKLVRGQKVVAIGSPLGLFNSVSDGIISGFRVIEGVDMIQFTAPISNGSSGGAVLNMYGEVIGISTAGFNDGQNINLAVGYEYIQTFVQGFL